MKNNFSAEQIRNTLREKLPEGIVVPRHTEKGHFYEFTPTKEVYASVTTKSGILDAPHLKKWASRLAVEHYIEHVGSSADLEQLKLASILAHQKVFTEAGDIGTQGHDVVDRYLQEWMHSGKQPEDIKQFVTVSDSRVTAIARSAEKFCIDYRVIPIASEMYLASRKFKYAGTLDSLMMVYRVKVPGKKSDCAHILFSSSTRNPNKKMCISCGELGEYQFAIADWKSSNSIMKVEYALQTVAYWYALKEMTGLTPKQIYIVRLDKTQAKYDILRVRNFPTAFKAFRHLSGVYDWLHDGTDKLVPLVKERIQVFLPEVSTPQGVAFTYA